jgi:hypothetical protein
VQLRMTLPCGLWNVLSCGSVQVKATVHLAVPNSLSLYQSYKTATEATM